jgi:hypothetical protein
MSITIKSRKISWVKYALFITHSSFEFPPHLPTQCVACSNPREVHSKGHGRETPIFSVLRVFVSKLA